MKNLDHYLDTAVEIKIDRPYNSVHPKHEDMIYPVNYGYIEGTVSGDGDEIDAYIIGVHEPLETFKGVVIGIVKRADDNEEKLVVAGRYCFTKEEVLSSIDFTEKYFESTLVMIDDPITFMHHRMNYIHDLCEGLKVHLKAKKDVYNMNYVNLKKGRYLQYYGIPVVTYKDIDIGFNIDSCFIEVFYEKERACKWLESYDDTYYFEMYGFKSCKDVEPTREGIMACDEEKIGIAVYIPYHLYHIELIEEILGRFYSV